MVRLFSAALFITLVAGFTSSAHAVIYLGTAEAEAALQFDPYHPDTPAFVALNSTGSAQVSGLTAVSSRGSVVAPSAIVRATTPVMTNVTINVADAGTIQQSSTHTTVASFKVTLTKASKANVTFHYFTVEGSALDGKSTEDFVGRSGFLTIKPGSTFIIIPVTVVAEKHEAAPYDLETFYLQLDQISGATPGRTKASALIKTSP